jgi:predicted nucleic acid-binding protein
VIHFSAGKTVTLPTKVYCDANFLISWHLPKHQWHYQAGYLLATLLARRASLHVSTLAIDEAWWRLLIRFYEEDHGDRTWRGDIVREDPNVLKMYEPEIRKFTESLLDLPKLEVIDQMHSKALVIQALDNIRDHSLAPRDAFHLALARAIGVPHIVTNDVQFQKVDADWLSVITFF